ncbi:unnamed protein product, partial [Hapterophycus canaliculatus]
LQSASQARSGGAHRIELCANLAQGGVTPSVGDIEGALQAVKGSRTKVHVLIRPRPGDFVYSALEKQVMEADVLAAVRAGAHGVVIGALVEDGSIDYDTTERLVRAAGATTGASEATAATDARSGSVSVTFHRAFDCCITEPVVALETLVRLGIDRLLTSGREASAWEGRDVIARLVAASNGRIAILPGAGITRENVKQLLFYTGAREVHVGSACQESIPVSILHQGAAMRLGFVAEGTSAAEPKQVTAHRVGEILTILSEGRS